MIKALVRLAHNILCVEATELRQRENPFRGGEGYFGRVVAWDKDSVMKIIRTDRMSINDRKKQLMEIKLHQKLDHPNITKCIGTYIN